MTPTSYLELIAAFRLLLTEKRETVMKAKRRYTNGLDKLAFAESQVFYFVFTYSSYIFQDLIILFKCRRYLFYSPSYFYCFAIKIRVTICILLGR